MTAVDQIVMLDSRKEAALQATADEFVAFQKGDVMKAFKGMIVLNGHLRVRIDALGSASGDPLRGSVPGGELGPS